MIDFPATLDAVPNLHKGVIISPIILLCHIIRATNIIRISKGCNFNCENELIRLRSASPADQFYKNRQSVAIP